MTCHSRGPLRAGAEWARPATSGRSRTPCDFAGNLVLAARKRALDSHSFHAPCASVLAAPTGCQLADVGTGAFNASERLDKKPLGERMGLSAVQMARMGASLDQALELEPEE
jgi:hypothetical protein